MGQMASLVDRDVTIALADPLGPLPPLLAAEESFVRDALPVRRREFQAGRACAREALAPFGFGDVALPVGPDRAPIWPDGMLGSIAHCRTLAIAIAAPSGAKISGIGIDVEPAEPLDLDLIPSICTAGEQNRVMLEAEPLLFAKVVFCMKEAAYKAQFSSTHTMLDFQDMLVDWDSPSAAFTASITASSIKKPPVIDGRWMIAEGYIIAYARCAG